MFNIFRKPPPPPPPIYKRQPIATAAVILTLIGMFVLGPVGVIYNGMSEELKKKVDNSTLQLMIEKDREALKRQDEALKKKNEKDEKQDQAIVENQKTLIMLRQQAIIAQPSNMKIVKKNKVEKKPLPPEIFEKYILMKPEIQVKYKKYLESRGYDIEGL
jgi:ABC-type lipoprotein release transport system permease subunit